MEIRVTSLKFAGQRFRKVLFFFFYRASESLVLYFSVFARTRICLFFFCDIARREMFGWIKQIAGEI